jgi:hypothetical protein
MFAIVRTVWIMDKVYGIRGKVKQMCQSICEKTYNHKQSTKSSQPILSGYQIARVDNDKVCSCWFNMRQIKSSGSTYILIYIENSPYNH